MEVFAVTLCFLFQTSFLIICCMFEAKNPQSTDGKEILSVLLIDILTWLESAFGLRETKVYCSNFLEMARDWHFMMKLNINKICYSGGDIMWQYCSSKEIQDHIFPHFSACGKWKPSERRMTGKDFPLKIEYYPSKEQCIATFDELYNNYTICPNPVYPHPNFPFISIIWVSWDQKGRQGQPCWK